MLELLIVRHAIALDRLESARQGVEDAARPLTETGEKKMVQATRGLRTLFPILDTIYTSPLLRARQTAEILANHYPASKIEELDTLSPEYSTKALIRSLAKQKGKRIAIVGHEPGLSMLTAALVCGNCDGDVQLKKGSAVLLQFDGKIVSGGGTLLWLSTPKQLRLLGKLS